MSLHATNMFYKISIKSPKFFMRKSIFSGKSHFFEIFRSVGTLWIRRWHCLVYILRHVSKSSIYSGQEILELFFSNTMRNIANSLKKLISLSFSAGPSLVGLAIVSVLLSEKEEYFHSTSPYSSRRENTSTLRVIMVIVR